MEIPSIGKIEISTGIDLTDTGTQLFLTNIANNLIIENGHISFIVYNTSTTSGSAFQNMPATLTMYFERAIFDNGIVDVSNIIVKNTT
jgi:hypothetical protein